MQSRQVEERALVQEQRLSRGHPQVLAVRAEIDELVGQLQQATIASLGVVQDRLDILIAQDGDLRAQMAEFSELESEMATLEGQTRIDLESHQFILSQLYQARIARGAAAPYVQILDPATVATPVPGRGRVAVVLGALLGLILGIGAAFSLEYLDRTVLAADRRWMETPF